MLINGEELIDWSLLSTGISYSTPTGITATPAVAFSYDAAGNRTMMTDGSGSVSYQYDHLNASVRGAVAAELEPLGSNAGTFSFVPPPAPQKWPQEYRTYPGFSAFDLLFGECVVDGISTPCGMVSGENSIQCQDNDCGPRARRVTNADGETRAFLTTPFMAFVNGVSGVFMPEWAEMGTPQEQADVILALSRGGNPTGIDSPRGQGQRQFAHNFLPQNSANKNPSDCAKFAGRLSGEASGNRAGGQVWLGRSWGLAVQGGNFAKYKTSGFKEMYVDQQGGWAYAHIMGVAAAYLIGDSKIVPLFGSQTGRQRMQAQFDEDARQLGDALGKQDAREIRERFSEINDDMAGMLVGMQIESMFNGNLSEKELHNFIFDLLCDF